MGVVAWFSLLAAYVLHVPFGDSIGIHGVRLLLGTSHLPLTPFCADAVHSLMPRAMALPGSIYPELALSLTVGYQRSSPRVSLPPQDPVVILADIVISHRTFEWNRCIVVRNRTTM